MLAKINALQSDLGSQMEKLEDLVKLQSIANEKIAELEQVVNASTLKYAPAFES